MPMPMNLHPDTVRDLQNEMARNQVLLIYMPKINADSFIHLAIWQGSFDVRDYTRTGGRKLRDSLNLSLLDVQSGMSPLVVRVGSGRPDVGSEHDWRAIIANANGTWVEEAKRVRQEGLALPIRSPAQKMPAQTTDTMSPTESGDARLSSDFIRQFGNLAPHYGLTKPRMTRVKANLGLLSQVNSYWEMKEDSCVIFFFILLDQKRQAQLGFCQRDASQRWRPFDELFREIAGNRKETGSLLPRLAPFAGLDPYQHFVSFELQLNNNQAIGCTTAKTNQVDTVITDVRNRCLYAVEAKTAPYPDTDQIFRMLNALQDLTGPDSTSVFRGFESKPVLLLDGSPSSPFLFGEVAIPVITWGQIVELLGSTALPAGWLGCD